MKRVLPYVLLTLFVLPLLWYGCWLLVLASPIAAVGSKLAPGVTKEGLLDVELGMTPAQVRKLLGPPLCQADGFEVVWKDAPETYLGRVVERSLPRQTWVYGRRGPVLGGGVDLGVVFVQGSVSRVYLDHFGLGVYYLDDRFHGLISQPDVLDSLPHREAGKRGKGQTTGSQHLGGGTSGPEPCAGNG